MWVIFLATYGLFLFGEGEIAAVSAFGGTDKLALFACDIATPQSL
jgi:hypothetical protein